MPQNNKEDKIIEKELSYRLTSIFFKMQQRLGRFYREKQYGDTIENELKAVSHRVKGFTVVELLVAMSVFAILMTIAVGAFIQGLRSQRLLTYMMAVNNNAGLALEQMAREIRTGYNFESGGSSLNFTNFDGKRVTYSLTNNRLTRKEGVSSNEIPLTAPDVRINYLSFIVSRGESGQKPNFCNPWRITILMEVASTKDIVQTAPLQTTISARVLPVEVPGAEEGIVRQCST